MHVCFFKGSYNTSMFAYVRKIFRNINSNHLWKYGDGNEKGDFYFTFLNFGKKKIQSFSMLLLLFKKTS